MQKLVVAGRVQAKEVRVGVKLRPEVLSGQLPAVLGFDEAGNDCTSTHLCLGGTETFLNQKATKTQFEKEKKALLFSAITHYSQGERHL